MLQTGRPTKLQVAARRGAASAKAGESAQQAVAQVHAMTNKGGMNGKNDTVQQTKLWRLPTGGRVGKEDQQSRKGHSAGRATWACIALGGWKINQLGGWKS